MGEAEDSVRRQMRGSSEAEQRKAQRAARAFAQDVGIIMPRVLGVLHAHSYPDHGVLSLFERRMIRANNGREYACWKVFNDGYDDLFRDTYLTSDGSFIYNRDELMNAETLGMKQGAFERAEIVKKLRKMAAYAG